MSKNKGSKLLYDAKKKCLGLWSPTHQIEEGREGGREARKEGRRKGGIRRNLKEVYITGLK